MKDEENTWRKMEEGIELGTVDIYADSAYIIELMNKWVYTLDTELDKVIKEKGILEGITPAFVNRVMERIFTYEEYLYLFKPIPREEYKFHIAYIYFDFANAHEKEVKLSRYKADPESYAKLIKSKEIPERMSFFLKQMVGGRNLLRAHIPYSSMYLNFLISGSVGSGKSTLMKNLIKSLYDNERPAQILLEPQGSLSEEVMLLKGISQEDMIYIDPLIDGRLSTPVINFLGLEPGQDPNGIAIRLSRMMSILCNGDLSPAMISLLRPCLTVLLEAGGYSILDLKKFFIKGEDEEFIKMGLAYPDTEFQSTFKRMNEAYYKQSKEAIIARLDVLAQDQDFRRITTNRTANHRNFSAPKINLRQAIADGKLIIFNCGGLEQDTKEAFGRLLVSLVTNIAFERTPEELKTCKRIFFHIDELSVFLSDDIIKGFDLSRQKKLHWVVAHQRVGQLKGSVHSNREENFLDSLIGNSGIKAIGHNQSPDTLNLYSTKLGIPKEKLYNLPNYSFRLRVRGRTDCEFIASNAINHPSMYLNEEEGRLRKQYMIDTYYDTLNGNSNIVVDDVRPPSPDQPWSGQLRVTLEDEDF